MDSRRSSGEGWLVRGETEGGACVACLGGLTIGHASLAKRNTVSTPNKAIYIIWALTTFLLYTTQKPFAYVTPYLPCLIRRLWPPFIS